MTQQTEVKTDCPLCSEMHNNCFVESTEIEGEQFDSYICFQCGMTSNSYLAFDSEKLEEYTKSHSRLMNDLKIFDKKSWLVWFPSVINMGPKGIIYPEGTVNDWYWNFASVIDVPEEERDQYEGHDKRLDIENPQKFGQFEFMEACKAMGIVKDNG